MLACPVSSEKDEQAAKARTEVRKPFIEARMQNPTPSTPVFFFLYSHFLIEGFILIMTVWHDVRILEHIRCYFCSVFVLTRE